MTKLQTIEGLRARLDLQTDKSGSCWLWMGRLGPTGYGAITVGELILGRRATNRGTHQVAWFLRHGSFAPKGLEVCHSCDEKRCVNPDHLFLGTRLDNARDAVAHGLYRRGSMSPGSKLTEEKVKAIRTEYSGARGQVSELARRFGVSRASILNAVNGKTWTHVPATSFRSRPDVEYTALSAEQARAEAKRERDDLRARLHRPGSVFAR